MAENFANQYQTTLDGAINDSTTTITVISVVGSPNANFRIKVDDEYMLVTDVSGSAFTVTRGIEGSEAASHADAATVTHVLTAGGLTQAIADGGGGAGAVTQTGIVSIENPDTYSDVDWAEVLDAIPEPGAISIVPTNDEAAESAWWLSDVDAMGFRLNVISAPVLEALYAFHAHAGDEDDGSTEIGLIEIAIVRFNANTTIWEVNKPFGTEEGHVMVAFLSQTNTNGGITTPSDWSYAGGGNNSNMVHQYVYVKVAGPSEPDTYTWTLGTGRRGHLVVLTYKNVNTSAPIDVSGAQSGSGASITAPSVLAGVNGRRLICGWSQTGGGIITAPEGMSPRYAQANAGSSSTADATLAVADQAVSPSGYTGTRVATGNTLSSMGVSVVLRRAL
jgi:hypothetical protein